MAQLHRRNLVVLKHIYVIGDNMDRCWLSSEYLGLSSDLAIEWETYTKILYDASIVLSLDCD